MPQFRGRSAQPPGRALPSGHVGKRRFDPEGNLAQSQFAVAPDMPFGAAVPFPLTPAVVALLRLFRRPLRAASEA